MLAYGEGKSQVSYKHVVLAIKDTEATFVSSHKLLWVSCTLLVAIVIASISSFYFYPEVWA
jgi:hypothetical protein